MPGKAGARPGRAPNIESERVFESDLELPLSLRASQLAERGARGVAVRSVELRRVGEAERLGPQLNPPGLGDAEELHQGEIGGFPTRATHHAHAGVTEGSGSRLPERRAVEPAIREESDLFGPFAVADAIRAGAARCGTGAVRGRDGQGEARVQSGNTAHLPSTEDAVNHSV